MININFLDKEHQKTSAYYIETKSHKLQLFLFLGHNLNQICILFTPTMRIYVLEQLQLSTPAVGSGKWTFAGQLPDNFDMCLKC